MQHFLNALLLGAICFEAALAFTANLAVHFDAGASLSFIGGVILGLRLFYALQFAFAAVGVERYGNDVAILPLLAAYREN